MIIDNLDNNLTLIIIAHRLSTVTDSDKIVVVKDGNIEAEGSHGELVEGCELYQRMWSAHCQYSEAV